MSYIIRCVMNLMGKIMEKRSFFKLHLLFGAAAVFLLFAGCNALDARNNYLRPVDFGNKLRGYGMNVSKVRPLDPRPLAAADAIEFTVNGANIGVYKYDINNKANRNRLEKINKDKKVFFMGIPYPVYEVSGSFIVVGLDKHKDKKRILEALRDFK